MAVSIAIFGVNTPITKAITAEELLAEISRLQAQITQLQEQLAEIQGTPAVWCHNFNFNLRIGDSGSEITALQTALQKEGFLTEISGEFDEKTASAVVGFQEKYKAEILTPWGLEHGTGYVGKTTKAKLNALYGCGVIPPPPVKYITVISPNGGERWVKGKTYDITWGSAGVDKVDIYARKIDPTMVCATCIVGIYCPPCNGTLIAKNISASSGKYSWTIPSDIALGDKYKIQIGDTGFYLGQNNIFDESDNYFSIVEKEEEIPGGYEISNIKLNGGGDSVTVKPGQSVSVSFSYKVWSRTGCPACIDQIVLGIDNKALTCAYHGIPGSYPGISGSYSGTIAAPQTPGTYYLYTAYATQYTCNDATALYPNTGYSLNKKIGTIVVASEEINYEINPYDADVKTCIDSEGKTWPATGEGSAAWFGWGGCTHNKYYYVNPGQQLRFHVYTDSCPGCVCYFPNFYVYEYENGSWISKKYFDLPDTKGITREEYYAPSSNMMKIYAPSCFYLDIYSPEPVKEKSITVLSPNGGEVWTSIDRVTDTLSGAENFRKDITWAGGSNPNSSNSVDAYLEQLINGQYVKIGRILPFGYGSIVWVVGVVSNPNCTYPDGVGNLPIPSDYCWLKTNMKVVPPGQYYVHLIDRITKAEDRSDAPFSIIALTPSITVLSPNDGGEKWEINTTQTVRWTVSNLSGSVYIYVDQDIDGDGSYERANYITSAAASVGQVSFTLPTAVLANEKNKVRILGGSYPYLEDTSDNYFSIITNVKAPVITEILPSQGIQGETIKMVIKGYNFTGAGEYSGCGISPVYDRGFQLTGCSVVPDSQINATYLISATAETGERKIKLSTPAGGMSNSVSFTILPKEKSITVISPNGGEVWTVGNTYDITWNSSGIDKVYIGLRCSEGGIVPTFTSTNIAREISASLGKYSWKVSTTGITMCDGYKITIGSEATTTKGTEVISGTYDESDNYFSIVEVAPSALKYLENQLASVSDAIAQLMEAIKELMKR